MPAIAISELAYLMREMRQRLELSQVKFATKLAVSFQSVNGAADIVEQAISTRKPVLA